MVLQLRRSDEGEARRSFWNGYDGEERRDLQWRRGRGACGSDLGLDDRVGAL